MIFKKDSRLYAAEVERKEGENILYFNYFGAPYVPSLSESAEVMARTVDSLVDNPSVSRIIFVQQRNYNYSGDQVFILSEIAQIYSFLTKQERILSPEKQGMFGGSEIHAREIAKFIYLLKSDPIGCYLELKRTIRTIEQREGNSQGDMNYVRFLERFEHLLEGTKLIHSVSDIVETSRPGDRELYSSIFRADIMPNFTFTRLVAQLPEGSEIIDQYELQADQEPITVTILKRGDSSYMYHILPPEYSLSEEHHMLLNLGKNVLTEHQPKAEEFTDTERIREVFFNVARDLLSELSSTKGIQLTYRELEKLSNILVRQTIGSGLIEVLLLDDRLQDIFINSPISQNPIFVRHSKYDECVTNILPSYEDADSWAAKLRLQSGRPLDEANPILDTDLVFGGVRARVAAIQRPLSPDGLAYAIRRHRDDPWTLPLFIHNNMIDSFTAGLLSFLIDGSRTFLLAGTRGSGKTSLLGSLMLEILPRLRTLVLEDTLELPVDALRKIGYNIQRMKVRSALTENTTEIGAAEGIRASLRLGDSALIVGEVRSTEAKALYEAMRVGALANVVAGTVHGASPYAVFDRIVNDLEVPITSFKATDLILVANPIKTPDGLHTLKRVIQLTEVRKHWTKDPLQEKGFVDLLRYNVETDKLEPTDELINGDSEVIKSIAAHVKGWAGDWDAVFDNIILRGKVKEEIVKIAVSMKKPQLMEAKFNSAANDAFHRISDEVTREHGLPLSDKVFPMWKEWLVENSAKF